MEQEVKKAKLAIDGKEVEVEEGTTILDAARQHGISIPTLCHHPALSSWGGCRICVVQVDGSPRLVASCVMPVRDGMEVVTSNEAIIESRRMILEFLFAERNHNCMFCPQSGDCELQKLAYELQMDHLTVSCSFRKFDTDITSEYMAIDHNRCILCGRCVRACREIAGASVLNYQNRGPCSLIGFDLAERRDQSSCDNSGVCVQVCPTGAIYNRLRTHYAVKGHKADWERKESVCTQCGLLCPISVSVRDNILLKIEGHLGNRNGRRDGGQLCHKGRFDVFMNPGERLQQPMIRNARGEWEKATWEKALTVAADSLKSIKDRHGSQALFGLISSASSNEELIAFRELVTNALGSPCLDALDGTSLRALLHAQASTGVMVKEAPWTAIPEADCILLVGVDPQERQPVISTLARRTVVEKGAQALVIGPRDALRPWTTSYVPAAEENLGPVVQAFLAAVLHSDKPAADPNNREKGPKSAGDSQRLELLKEAGWDEDTIAGFDQAAAAFAAAKNPIVIVGFSQDENSWLPAAVKLAALKGNLPDGTSRLVVLKESGNSAGAWKLGIASAVARNGREQWKGGVVALNGENPASLILSSSLEFLAVASPYRFPELMQHAHVLLPKPLWLEEPGTYASLDGTEWTYKESVLAAPTGIPESWQTWANIAKRLSGKIVVSGWEEMRKRAEEEMRG